MHIAVSTASLSAQHTKMDYTWYALRIDIVFIYTNYHNIIESFRNESVDGTESKR